MAFDSLPFIEDFSVPKVTSVAPKRNASIPKMATPSTKHGSTLWSFWNIPLPQPPANGELLPWEFKVCALQVSWGCWQDGIHRETLHVTLSKWSRLQVIIVQQAIFHQQLIVCKLQVTDRMGRCCVAFHSSQLNRFPHSSSRPESFFNSKTTTVQK